MKVRLGRVALCSLLVTLLGAVQAPMPVRAVETAAVATLSGRVSVDGEPLRGVRVTISETSANLSNQVVTTKDDGAFSVSVPTGVYAVTAYAASALKTPGDLLTRAIYGLQVQADTHVDVAVERGTVVQTCILGSGGIPLPGAKVDVFDAVRDNVASESADASGWVRLVLAPDYVLFVTPPASATRETTMWLRYEELSLDANGIARPIRLDTLDDPVDEGNGVMRLYRGSAPGRHIVIGMVSEGFTSGDEPFVDRNGNGVCDDEPYLDTNGDGGYDAGEPFVDANQNGKRDTEPFTDLNGDGICNRDERELFLDSAMFRLRVLLGFPVYREIRERLDIYAVFVASQQAGSDFPTLAVPVSRDTAFDSEFQSTNYIFDFDRLKVSLDAERRLGEYDYLALVLNDVYGVGRETGGGIVVLNGGRRPENNYTVAHEFGHTIGRLADEYFYYDGAPPYSRDEPNFPNVTRTSAIGALKWSRFVRPGTEVPTADGSPGVGAFEGGLYRRLGISRPSFSCLMRRYGFFCPVCAATMVESLRVRLDDPAPTRPTLSLPLAGAVAHSNFTVACAVPDLADVASVDAVVDGQPVGAPTTVSPFGITLDASYLSNGAHTIAADVRLVNGATVRAAAVTIAVAHASPSEPEIGMPSFSHGTLVLPEAATLTIPGAVVLVNGADRYPLEIRRDGTVGVVKKAPGSQSGVRFAKAVRRNRTVTVQVVNPDGGRSPSVVFRR